MTRRAEFVVATIALLIAALWLVGWIA